MRLAKEDDRLDRPSQHNAALVTRFETLPDDDIFGPDRDADPAAGPVLFRLSI